MKKWSLTFIAIIVIMGSILFASYNNSDSKAYKEAKDIVIARAKYPDTVKFLNDKKNIFEENGEYTIFGEASSQNGFGATVHLTFEIKLKENKNEYSGFDIVDVNISQN